jgi:hypothetical protein
MYVGLISWASLRTTPSNGRFAFHSSTALLVVERFCKEISKGLDIDELLEKECWFLKVGSLIQ